MLINNGLYLGAACAYVLLLLVLAVNSDWFQVTRSYSSCPFLFTLVVYNYSFLVGDSKKFGLASNPWWESKKHDWNNLCVTLFIPKEWPQPVLLYTHH